MVPADRPSLTSIALALAAASDRDGYLPRVTRRRGVPWWSVQALVPPLVTLSAKPVMVSSTKSVCGAADLAWARNRSVKCTFIAVAPDFGDGCTTMRAAPKDQFRAPIGECAVARLRSGATASNICADEISVSDVSSRCGLRLEIAADRLHHWFQTRCSCVWGGVESMGSSILQQTPPGANARS